MCMHVWQESVCVCVCDMMFMKAFFGSLCMMFMKAFFGSLCMMFVKAFFGSLCMMFVKAFFGSLCMMFVKAFFGSQGKDIGGLREVERRLKDQVQSAKDQVICHQ
jgi:hypothetical protein